jgi:PAS domain S-box-containing protein
MPCAIVVSDATQPDHPIIHANPAALKLTGYSLQDLIGKNARIFQGPLTDRNVVTEIRQAVRERREGTWEILNYRKDGSCFWNEFRLALLRDESGQITHLLGIQLDIAERKKTQAELERKQRMLEIVNRLQRQFIAGSNAPELFRQIMLASLEITQSEYGFIGEVREDIQGKYLKTFALSDLSWDDRSRALYRLHQEGSLDFRSLNNLFGEVIRTGEVVISNDPHNDPRRGGLPGGHPPLRAFLGIPFFSGSEMLGVIGLGNRPNGYSPEIVELIEPLLATTSTMIAAIRAQRQQSESEAELRESESRLRAIGDNLPNGGIYRLQRWSDDRTQFHYLSQGIESIFGVPPHEALADASRLYACLHPDDAIKVNQSQKESLANLTPMRCEFRIRTPQGQERWISSRSCPTRQPDGSAIWDGAMFDITEMKLAEQNLHEQKHFVQAIAEASPHTIYLYDLIERRNIWANRKIETVLGYSPEEVQELGSEFLTHVLHPDDLAKLPELFARWERVRDGEILETEHRMRRADGTWRWFVGYDIVFSRTAEGKVHQFLGTTQDITDRKRVEKELRESQTLLQQTARVSKVGGWDYDALANQLIWSEETYRIHEVPPSFKPNLETAIDFYHPEDREKIRLAVLRGFEEGKPWEGEYRLITATGRIRWTHSIGNVEIVDGKLKRLWGVFQDITDRKKTEEELAFSHLVLRKTGDMVLVFGADHLDEMQAKIVYVNEAFERELGHSRKEVIGYSPCLLYGPLTDRETRQRFHLALAERRAIRANQLVYRKDGRIVGSKSISNPSPSPGARSAISSR